MNEEIPYNPPGLDEYIRDGARKNSALLRKMQGKPEAVETAKVQGQFAPCPGCAALVDWLKAEMDDDEIGKINARDHGEWSRYEHLEGHRTGLLHVLHHIRAAQHNDQALRLPPKNL